MPEGHLGRLLPRVTASQAAAPWTSPQAQQTGPVEFAVSRSSACTTAKSTPSGLRYRIHPLQLRRLAVEAGVRRRFAPHQLRHAHAVEMAREGVPLNVIQRQLGHANLRVTTVYLQGIDSAEIINAVHARMAPMMPASAGLRS